MHLLSSNPIHFFPCTCLFLLFQSSIRAQHICSPSSQGNYKNGSQYETNLHHLLQSLNTTTPSKGYYNTSSGVDPDQVYGLAQCWIGIPLGTCEKCINTSTVEIVQLCPNNKEAFIRNEYCLLRYSHRRFFSEPDTVHNDSMHNRNNATYPYIFNDYVLKLMRNLSDRVLSPAMFAADSVRSPDFPIYGSVECVRDISTKDCYSCLQTMIGEIRDCCYGNLGGQVFSMSCYIRYEVHPFIEALPPPPPVGTPTVLPPVPSPLHDPTPPAVHAPPRPPPGNKSRVIIIVVVSLILGLVLFGLGIYYCIQRSKRPHKDKEEHRALSLNSGTLDGLELGDASMQDVELPIIDFATIQDATDNFSDENKLGEGGYGPVYKGMLSDGKEVAVKRLLRISEQGLEQFKNEVTLIAKLQHKNLVRLLYYCIDKREKLLIYEYMSNTSLDVFLFDPVKRAQLGWERCHNIVCGIAKGLNYLHEDSRLKIIHRDLKASNVLLDHEMNPKISDFGIARFLGGNESQLNTNRVVGTYGYMAPEYGMGGLFSAKSDVYSFGILLLEIISGKRNSIDHLRNGTQSLLVNVWGLWCNGKERELIDPLLTESCPANEVLRWIHIGLLCVQHDAADRPTMSSVILMLGSEYMKLPEPKQPGFFFARADVESGGSSTSAKIYSNNYATISDLEPR